MFGLEERGRNENEGRESEWKQYFFHSFW
jgi:hypothetical protein